MRLALLGFAAVFLAPSLLTAQLSAPADPQSTSVVPNTGQASGSLSESPSAASAPQQPRVTDDPISRQSAKAAERAQKEQAKADAKAAKQAEKEKREAEQDAKYLKLQDNEIAATAFDANGNPVKLPPCSKKDKVCQQKRKELLSAKKIPLVVQNGTLTVNGWTGKARLNYDVKNFQFLYVSVPGYGTIVASPDHFPSSTELKEALDGQTLTITTRDNQVVQLTGDAPLSGKGKRSIYYNVDRSYSQPGSYPTLGYGFVDRAPYAWPGALPPTEDQKRRTAKVPNLPGGMEASQLTLPCQPVAGGHSQEQIRVNGMLVAPPACRSNGIVGTPSAYSSGERPPDGSGAASTGGAEDRSR